MKINIIQLPKIRDMLEELQQNLHALEQLGRPAVSETTFKVEDREHNEMHDISCAELRSIFQARVDQSLKTLNELHQIEFTLAPPAVPVKRKTEAVTEDDGLGPDHETFLIEKLPALGPEQRR
jgi:hypothetical protein